MVEDEHEKLREETNSNLDENNKEIKGSEQNLEPLAEDDVKSETLDTNDDEFDESNLPWDVAKAKADVLSAFEENSELDLLKVLKDNSFFFFDLYSRKWGIQPIFRGLNFGTEFKCDFAWLNDNSSGPEWVLVEIEAPKMPLFKTTGKPTVKLYDAIEQVHTWEQYFEENKREKKANIWRCSTI